MAFYLLILKGACSGFLLELTSLWGTKGKLFEFWKPVKSIELHSTKISTHLQMEWKKDPSALFMWFLFLIFFPKIGKFKLLGCCAIAWEVLGSIPTVGHGTLHVFANSEF